MLYNIYILHDIRKRKANWIGHILRRNCLLQQLIEGKIKGQIEVTRRRGKRCKKLLDDIKDRRGYCQLKEEALDHTMWKNHFGRGFGPVVWQITDDDDDVHVYTLVILPTFKKFQHDKYLVLCTQCWDSWWGTVDLSETCRIYQNKLEK